jgi:hypothetical protein
MEFFKKHVDTIFILGAIITSMLWMNMKFNQVDKEFFSLKSEFDQRFANVDKEMAIIKTVLIMKNIMPSELAIKEEK